MTIILSGTPSDTTLLEICQDAAYEIGFPAPSTIVGNTDATAQQLFRLANKEGEILSQATQWEVLVSEYTFTLVSGDQDYALPSDFRYIVPSTTWDRTSKRIVINPITSQYWQFLKGWTTINGLHLRARIRAGELEFEQTIGSSDAGKTIAFEYLSDKWAQSDGGTAKNKFTLDTDIPRLDAEVITQGVVWRFEKAKGLDWEANYQEYMRLRSMQIARDGGSRIIRLDGKRGKGVIGFNVPDRDFG